MSSSLCFLYENSETLYRGIFLSILHPSQPAERRRRVMRLGRRRSRELEQVRSNCVLLKEKTRNRTHQKWGCPYHCVNIFLVQWQSRERCEIRYLYSQLILADFCRSALAETNC